MATVDGWPAQSLVVDQIELRKNLAGLLARDTSGNARAGLLPAHTATIVTATSSMNVAVGAFQAALVRAGGPVFLANDGTVNVALAAAPAANSRIDAVYVRQREDGYGGLADGANGPIIDKVTGTASSSPVAPAVPAGAIALATVLIPSTATATNSSGVVITQVFPYTAAEGGVVLLRNQVEQDAWAPHDGSPAYRLDTGTEYLRVAGAWAPAGGVMPRITLAPNGTQTVNNQFGVTNWAPPGTGDSDQVLGTDWYQYSNSGGIGSVQVKRSGRYRVTVRMAVQNANGQSIAAYLIRNGDTNTPIAQDAVETNANYGKMLKLDEPSIQLAANATLGLYIPAVTQALSIGGNGRAAGQFDVQYLGPA